MTALNPMRVKAALVADSGRHELDPVSNGTVNAPEQN